MATKDRGWVALLGWAALVFLVCPGAAPLAASQDGGASKPDVNVVKAIRHATPTVIEVELHSSREFPVRDEIVTLRIGNKEFKKSRYPDDGRLDTLIFIVDSDEFEQVVDGDVMEVVYGKPEGGGHRWQFGKLNKSLLQR